MENELPSDTLDQINLTPAAWNERDTILAALEDSDGNRSHENNLA